MVAPKPMAFPRSFVQIFQAAAQESSIAAQSAARSYAGTLRVGRKPVYGPARSVEGRSLARPTNTAALLRVCPKSERPRREPRPLDGKGGAGFRPNRSYTSLPRLRGRAWGGA